MFGFLFITKAILLEVTCTWLIPISAAGLWAAFLFNHATGAYNEEYYHEFLRNASYFSYSNGSSKHDTGSGISQYNFIISAQLCLLTLLTVASFFSIYYNFNKRSYAIVANPVVNVSVSPPKHYVKSVDVRAWLDTLDLYFEATGVTADRQKCVVLFSRLETSSLKLLQGLTVDAIQELADYNELKGHMIHLFATVGIDSPTAITQFGRRCQLPDENVSSYYAQLTELAQLAFKNMSKNELKKVISKQFSERIGNPTLRIELLRVLESNPTSDVLELARTFSQFTQSPSSPTVSACLSAIDTCICRGSSSPTTCTKCTRNVKLTHLGTNGRVAPGKLCYVCRTEGHFAKNCPDQDKTPSQILNKATRKADEQLHKIVGSCQVNGVPCEFLCDTGATMSIVRLDVLTSEDLVKMSSVNTRVFTMTGEMATIIGKIDVRLKIGSSEMVGCVLVSRDLYFDFLLGMDFLSTCPLTRALIYELRDKLTTNCAEPLLIAINEAGREANDDSALEAELVMLSTAEHMGDFDVNENELPLNVYHDVFQVLDSPLESEY